MKGLQTSRVVVVDDDPVEADALMRGLARLGIGAVYVSGLEPAEYAALPRDGIRLVFLDLHLLDTADPILHAVGVLTDVVDPTSHETAVVCWTKHGEEVAAFEGYLAERVPGFVPPFVLSLPKGDFGLTGSGGTADVARLSAAISDAMADHHSFCLIGEWEQFVHDATSHVTVLLSKASQDGGCIGLLDVQAAVVRAAAGGSCEDQCAAMVHLVEGSAQVLLDHLYGPAASGMEPSATTEALLDKVKAGPHLAPGARARLNKALLTAEIPPGSKTVSTGNVYLASGWDAAVCGEFPLECDGGGIRAFLYQAWPPPRDIVKESQKFKDWKAEVKVFSPHCIPCLLELTPACDHAQNKAVFSRLLGGLLVCRPKVWGEMLATEYVRDGDLELPAGSRGFCRQLPFVTLSSAGIETGEYSLVVDARYLVTVPVSRLATAQPAFRFRQEIAIDVAAWFAGHAARPGYICVG